MLQMVGVLAVKATKLQRDALQLLLGTVSRTTTSNLWKLLEHFFSVDEDPEEAKAAEASSLMKLLKAQCEECKQDSLVACSISGKGKFH